MDPLILTDVQWAVIEPLYQSKLSDPGRRGKSNHMFIEGDWRIARTGSPWRDLPASGGRWNTIDSRYQDWRRKGGFQRIFEALSETPGMKYAMIDRTIVKIRRHGQGTKGGPKPSYRL